MNRIKNAVLVTLLALSVLAVGIYASDDGSNLGDAQKKVEFKKDITATDKKIEIKAEKTMFDGTEIKFETKFEKDLVTGDFKLDIKSEKDFNDLIDFDRTLELTIVKDANGKMVTAKENGVEVPFDEMFHDELKMVVHKLGLESKMKSIHSEMGHGMSDGMSG